MTSMLHLNNCRFEILTSGPEFLGLGRIWVGESQVRSGRLPLRPTTQTFPDGFELASCHLKSVQESETEIRLCLEVKFRGREIKLLRDHSFDTIHSLEDWDETTFTGTGQLDLVLRPATDSFNGVEFVGFSYHYEYRSDNTALFYLMDKASWELDGDIAGVTAYSQSACSDPVVTFDAETAWSTEGLLPFLLEDEKQNAIMTHNLPRWASHGSFDFQFRGDTTLIGVFDRVELIRSIVARDAGKPELKCFDKHIFDQTGEFSTSPKKILLNHEAKSVTDQQNLWTWIHCEVEERARQEFGLVEEPLHPRLCVNYWSNFTVDTYYKDLIPAAAALGFREVFIDNLKKSAMTERSPLPGTFNWNMCCGHEYEISPVLGGNKKVKDFVQACAAAGIGPVSWTNNDQALSSPLNQSERDDPGWYVLLEDARQKYGGSYAAVMSILDLSVPAAREYFVKAHLEIKAQTGLSSYLFDSFYNFAIMPVSYRDMRPRTQWRGTLQAMKELQDGGVHFLIESFGPFGTPQHGHPASYNLDSIFICYRIGLGDGYTTIPTSNPISNYHPEDAPAFYYTLAHMAGGPVSLFKDGKRRDEIWTLEHRQALEDYHRSLEYMKVRYLQNDGLAVLWHDAQGQRATLFNFADRRCALPGRVHDLTLGADLTPAAEYVLQANHTYVVTGAEELPRCIEGRNLQE